VAKLLTPVALLIVAFLAQQPPAAPAASALDYNFFKTRVQPIFLAKRPGHARCYVCHRPGGAGPAYLQALSPGASSWTDAQSRKNFETVQAYVNPAAPTMSRLLMHPLAPEAGGDDFHGGGRQFASRETPEFQAIVAWIRGETLSK
jgi:hypothetical protein